MLQSTRSHIRGNDRLLPSLESWSYGIRSPTSSCATPEGSEIRSLTSGFMAMRLSSSPRIQSQLSMGMVPSKLPSREQGIISQALGLHLTKKILFFHRPTKKGHFPKKINPTPRDLVEAISGPENDTKPMSHSPPQNCSRILYTVEVAQASGVTNDFYSNIVSWSKTAKQVAVGVNKTCSIWKLNKNCKTPISFECPDVITCVSCSYEDLVVIGTEAGKIYVISQSDGRLRATYILDNIPIHTCTWFKNNKRFLVGDSSGNVYMIKTIHKQGILILKKDFTFKFHQQLE
ncbi:hypothetical protein PSN45_001178 [Yamadazyma tenuis]|uniref:uncharacterized protein n=1 Tax=Candida tenuis TaxID=2315449 RepID=UPI00279CDDE9|nr:hypothetical protein PSN45_001178 [Yamadazyma tenuis]